MNEEFLSPGPGMMLVQIEDKQVQRVIAKTLPGDRPCEMSRDIPELRDGEEYIEVLGGIGYIVPVPR